MSRLIYTTGQAAKLLGITPHAIRRLVAAGLLTAAPTSGGHLRIPSTEIDRLKKEGIPPVPQIVDQGENRENEGDGFGHKGEPPVGFIRPQHSDAVSTSFDEVRIAENLLKKRRIELDATELEDQFEEHDERERAAREQRSAAVEAARKRQQWEGEWQEYALRRFPSDAPSSAKLELPRHVLEAFQNTDPEQSDFLTRSLVDAAIEKCSAAWQRQQEIEKAIKNAVDDLPLGAKSLFELTSWQVRAIQAARTAADALSSNASVKEIEAVARQAVGPVIQEFEHQKTCDRFVSRSYVDGAYTDEQEEAKDLLLRALEALPIGASVRQMEKAKEEALRPLVERVAPRLDRAVREDVIRRTSFPWDFPQQAREAAEQAIHQSLAQVPTGTSRAALEVVRQQALQPFLDAHARQNRKEALIDCGLSTIVYYLLKLSYERRFEGSAMATDSKIKQVIRRELEREMTGDESADHVAGRIRSLVRRELGIPKKGAKA